MKTLQHVNMHEAIAALSGALDLVGVDEVRHGKRVAMIARAVADRLGWSATDRMAMLHAGMLHDCGVSRIHEHRQLTETLEWDGAEDHCIRGAEYLAACRPVAHLADDIRYHHTRWRTLLELPLAPDLRLRTNLLFLADRIDVLQAPFLNSEHILNEFSNIIARIRGLAGLLFCPELVEAFAELAEVEAFWLAMEPEYLDEDLRVIGAGLEPVLLDMAELKDLATLFSRVVDAKTPFTDEHSQRVALIARELGADFGLSGCHLEQIEIAGLLHDIGKLRVSEDIINKPGGLTPSERATMHRHSYDTFRILLRVFADSKIPIWAGYHHETLVGDGYPFRSQPKELDLECRIIAVADIFQALIQVRPYRPSVTAEEALADLRRRVAEGKLDPDVVGKLAARAEAYYQLASA
ncbi:HD-GYP domain-containing protein [Methylomonas sp. CM2]|uniref:HD-GYP domain-containing protein n=1 Tax=Methylomonas sp. CM2 TaxID=3417647 RepID=UPI003CF29423